MITSIDSDKCTGCGSCVRKCTLDVFSLDTRQKAISPCMAACPCRVDIRGILFLLQQDRQEEALELLKQSVPFPALTSYLCSHPCEAACLRQPEGERVNICGLERYLGSLDLRTPPPLVKEKHAAQVAVIGAGLAGMSMAYFLRSRGYPVVIFDGNETPGGELLRHPPEGMPGNLPAHCADTLRKMGVEFRMGVRIGQDGDQTLRQLFLNNIRAVCIAAGSREQFERCFPEMIAVDGSIVADSRTMQTKAEGLFAAGGCCGASAAETATAQALDAALSAHAFLSGIDMMIGRPHRPVAAPLPPALPSFAPGIASRKDGWKDAMSLEEMQRESLRCCTCGSKAYIAHPDDCMTCFTCEMSCPAGAVSVHPFKEILPRTLKESWERDS